MALVEVDGIKLDVDARIFSDMRFLFLYGRLADPAPKDESAALDMAKLVQLVFGDDTERVLQELAERNGGFVGTEEFGDFIGKLTEALPDLKG